MLCHLCDSKIRGKKHRVLYRIGENLVHGYVCERCWNQHDNVAEAVVKKKAKTGKCMDIRPCEKCGRTDFGSDQARRAHQGKCLGKNPPPALEKPKPLEEKVNKKLKETAKALRKLAPPSVMPADKYSEVPVGDPQENTGRRKRKTRAEMTASDKARSSRNKGNSFERDVRRELALWYGEDPKVVASKDSKFQRAPGSGGTSPANWPLDLFVPPDFPWAVECKNREGDEGFDRMERFFTADKYPLIDWFRTAEEELVAAKVERPLLLVFKKSGSPIMVAFRRPSMASGEHVMLDAKHMTICGAPFGEIMVTDLAGLETWPLDTWKSAYAVSDRGTYLPRKWS